MSLRDAARANWRADLHEYAAAGMAAGGLSGRADDEAAQAASKREYAALMVELANAKAGFAADGSLGPKAILDDVKQRVVAFRRDERLKGVSVRTLDNFIEPSDAELVEQGY